MRKIYFIILFSLLVLAKHGFAQAPNACFSASTSQNFPIAQCGAFFIQLNNCSTGTYDSAIWKLQISNNLNCAAPWGISFITAKGGAAASTGTGYSLTVYGSYRLCLTLINRTTGQKDSFCTCIAKVYPIPNPNFSASDTLNCGSLTTTITPNISSGTAPFGPITWFFGDNQTQTTSSAIPVTHTYSCKNTFPPCYTVTISVTDANGCSKVITKPCMLSVPCSPNASIAVTGGNTCIAPSSISMHASATSLIGAGIYTWWFPPNTSPPFPPAFGPSTNSNVSNTFNSYGCKDVILAVKDSITGCTDTATLINAICLQGVNVTSLSANSTQVCCGKNFVVSLNATSNPISNPICVISGTLVATPIGVGGSPIVLGLINSSQSSSFVLPCGTSIPVVYNICFQNNQVTNLCNNCTVTYSGCFQITIMPSPTAHINLTAPTLASYCSSGNQFCFNASTPANNLTGTTYEWFLNSVNSSVLSNTTTFCTTFSNFGNFKIYLRSCQSAANGGCCSLDSITVSQQKPNGSLSITRLNGCDSFYTKISVFPRTDSLYIFDLGDGTPPIVTTDDTVRHYYGCNIDTCYTLKVTHIAYSQNGFACVDTITRYKIIKIGHKMTPVIQMAPPIQCLIKKQACVSVNPNVPGLIPPPNSSPSCVLKVCHWYFTKPDDVTPVVQSFVCDSPKVCFDDTGHFDAHYVIVNNGCSDTLIVPRAVVINGIIGTFSDSLHCSVGGTLANTCMTFKSKFKVYPPPTDSTHIKFIISSGTCGAPAFYNFVVAPNGAYPSFSHCFCNTGTYTVTMITRNSSNFCPPDTTIKTEVIYPVKAVIDILPPNTNLNQCLPYTFNFTSVNSSPSSPAPPFINWIFGDGKKSTLRSPSHLYDSCGIFTVKLIIANASKTCVDSTQKIVKIHAIKGRIDIGYPKATCNVCIVLTNNLQFCGGSPDSTYFSFGDGTSHTFHGNWTTYTHCYKIAPTNNMYYKVWDDIGCSIYSYLAPPIISGIQPVICGLFDTIICQGTTVNFADCSNGLISTRCWAMNTAACSSTIPCQSTNQNFSYAFASPGYYYLNLRLNNNYGTCGKDTCVRIQVLNPAASFIGRDSMSCPGTFDTLTNTTIGAYDKLIVSMSSPSINFYQTFTYYKNQGGIPNMVALPIGYPADYKICWNAISNSGCSDSICKNLHVAGPIGQLSCSNVYACVGDSVCCQLVTNSTISPIIKFSDGSFKILPIQSSGIYNFCHKYTFAGHQLVQAFIDDGIGCSYPVQDTVHVDGPTANFSWTPYKKDFCGSATVTMVDSSFATLYPLDNTQYRWTVYDASGNVFANYSQVTPVVTINIPGSYSMRLIIKSTFGCADTILKPFIRIHPYPTAIFNITPDTICINQCVNFTNQSLNPDTLGGYKWYINFPNSAPFSTIVNPNYCFTSLPGTYHITLIDSSKHGCIDTSSVKDVLVLSSLIAGYNQTNNLICGNSGAITFTSNSVPNSGITWEWNFGDGSPKIPQGNQSAVTHTFVRPLTVIDTCYNVKLIIRNSSGCIDSISHQVCISSEPFAGLNLSSHNACNPLNVVFNDTSSSQATISNYTIDFGDATPLFSSATAPINLNHRFTNSTSNFTRSYFLTYTITTIYGCVSEIHDTIVVYPIPSASLTVSKDSICGNSGNINFTSTSTPNTGINFTWYWNDGTIATGPGNFPNPVHLYNLPVGIADTCYLMQMILSNQFGCKDTATQQICLSAKPNVHLLLGSQSSCNPLLTSFTDSTQSLVPIANYDLVFGDNTNYFSATAPNNVPKIYSNSSNLFVSTFVANYTVTTTLGCSSEVTDTFNVYPIPLACAGINDSVCPGNNITIGCSPVVGMSYNWFNPIGGVFTPNNTVASPSVSPFNSTTYSLKQTNQYGCADTANVIISIKGLLVPNAGRDTAVCKGATVNLLASGGLNYKWYKLSNYQLLSTSSMLTLSAYKTDSFRVIINGTCDSAAIDINVYVFDPPLVSIDNNDQTIFGGHKIQITTKVSTELAHFDWEPLEGIVGTNAEHNVIVAPDVNTIYQVTMIDEYGCKDSDNVKIMVLCDKENSIYIPNAFEPNQPSNNRNSRFYIQGIGIKEVVYLRIYNRWGDELFNMEHFPINDQSYGWDGTRNGVKVGNDVYMYQMQILCSNGTIFPISGNITVIK